MQDDRDLRKEAEAASVMARVFRQSPRDSTRRLHLGAGGAAMLLAVLLTVLGTAVFGWAHRRFLAERVQPWEAVPAWNNVALEPAHGPEQKDSADIGIKNSATALHEQPTGQPDQQPQHLHSGVSVPADELNRPLADLLAPGDSDQLGRLGKGSGRGEEAASTR